MNCKLLVVPSPSTKAVNCLLTLIKKFPDPPLVPTSPVPFNFSYTKVKSMIPSSLVALVHDRKSNIK